MLKAEKYIKSLSNEKLKKLAKDYLQFYDSGILSKSLQEVIKKNKLSSMIFSEGIEFINNIVTYEVFSRWTKNLI